MNKLEAAKAVARLVVGTGAGKIAKDIIKSNTDPKNAIDAITYTAGAVALGGIASEAAKTYLDKKIESTVESVERIKAEVRKNATPEEAEIIEAAKENPLDPDVVAQVAETVKARLGKQLPTNPA